MRLPTAALPLGTRRVELGELVGRGSRTGAHQALLVSENGTRLRVLVKLFDAMPSDDADAFAKHLGSAVSRAVLVQHPNVAQVFEHGVDNGRAYVVTEHVPGVTLADLVSTLESEGQRLGFDVALFVGCEVADALAGAYAARDHEGFPARVLHGDLSARQVMLGFAGQVKVTDFELGRVSSAQSGVRSLRTVASRLEPLAPELVEGAPAGPRTDVFALGMLLRAMFVGPRFPSGISHSQALAMVRKGEAYLPPFHPRIPQALAELVSKATAVAPEERFPSVRALAHELRKIAFTHGVGDARPFLARALERAFPGESPFATDGSDDDDDAADGWPADAADAGAPEGDDEPPYDSEYPPPRTSAPSLRVARRDRDDDGDSDDVREFRASLDASPREHAHHDEGESYDPYESLAGEGLDAHGVPDLAKTHALPALRAPRTLDIDEDFDPEATVNLRG